MTKVAKQPEGKRQTVRVKHITLYRPTPALGPRMRW